MVGEIAEVKNRCFQWIIKDFSELVNKKEFEELCSPNFSFAYTEYKLVIKRSEENIFCVDLIRKSDRDAVDVKIWVKACRGKHMSEMCSRTVAQNSKMISFSLGAEYSKILLHNFYDPTVFVFCEFEACRVFACLEKPQVSNKRKASDEGEVTREKVTDMYVKVVKIQECKIVEKLQKDLEYMLYSRESCDVTFRVQSKEFPAHKSILGARCPVFNSMFCLEMKEKETGIVDIEDCDPWIFSDFLNYLYSGRTQHISDDNVCQLYTVSDKYRVDELKEACVLFMKGHISVGTVCDVLSLALQHSLEDLVQLCCKIFCLRALDIVKTAKWQTFLIKHPQMANQLFLKALAREKLKCTCTNKNHGN